MDIRSVNISVESENIKVTILLTNLQSLPSDDPLSEADLLFAVHWMLTGKEELEGAWTVRADFHPALSVPWSFRSYRPCPEADYCTIRDLSGEVDITGSSITIFLPVSQLSPISKELSLNAFDARTQGHWPSEDMVVSDSAYAQEGAKIILQPKIANSSNAPAPEPEPARASPGPEFGLLVLATSVLAARRSTMLNRR